ncbi:ankyrin repeat-containing domain protein [Mycena haematopus]|nr:ankyrin repeat-containing domain protein [Mycena haematopus]
MAPKTPRNINHLGTEIQQRSLFSAIFRIEMRGDVAIALLGSLHLSMMSALGIWLWSDLSSFGTATGADACAAQLSSYVILGKHVPLGSNALRICSLIIYSIFLTPGFNLLLPLVGFLAIFFVYRAFHGRRYAHRFDPSSNRNLRHTHGSNEKTGPAHADSKGLVGRSLLVLEAWYNPFLVPVIAGMVLLFAINLVFIFNIELTLRTNRPLRTSGEALWTFGQILAILLLVLPIRDLRLFGSRRNFTSLLQNAIRWQAPTEVLRDLVRRGADVNVRAEGSKYPTALLLAVTDRRDVEFTGMLLMYGANPNIEDDRDCTPLQAASLYPDLQIVRLLLTYGANPNIEGGEYGTALQAAAHAGDLQIVQFLLENNADVNIQGGRYGTAVQAASSSGHTEIIELLRTHGSQQNHSEEML